MSAIPATGPQREDLGLVHQQMSERCYRIGLCAARCDGITGTNAQAFANTMLRWLICAPAAREKSAEGVILDLKHAKTAALGRHFADPVIRLVFLINLALVILTIVEAEWRQTIVFTTILVALVCNRLYVLRKWLAKAPALLPQLPAPGTIVTAGLSALSIGSTAMAYQRIRIEEVKLRRASGFNTPGWRFQYFIDHLELGTDGRTFHLDATVVSNGQ